MVKIQFMRCFMRILHCLSQLPMKTGSGVYYDTVIAYMRQFGHKNAALYGVQEPFAPAPVCSMAFPVQFNTDSLPFPVPGMSDEMPYPSTVYSEMTDEQITVYRTAFRRRLEEAKRIFQPDVVISHHFFIMTAVVRDVFPDTPVIGVSHGTDLRQLKKHERFRQYVSAAAELEAYWALGKNDKKCIAELFGIPAKRIKIMGGGFKDSVFFAEKPGPEKRERLIKKAPLVVYAGKISRSKGIFEFVQAFAGAQKEFSRRHRTEPARLLYIGNGTAEQIDELKRLSGYCPNLAFRPAMLQPELAALLRQADFYVLPSYYEGIALTAVEAMACNLPVITTEIAGLMELLGPVVNASGFIEYVGLPRLYEVDKPVEEDIPAYIGRLTEAVLRQFEQWAEGKSMPPEVRKEVESHSWHEIVKRMEGELRTLVQA